jgi:16S rRNA (cytidine1402-2'-O)-methyltransferase
MSTLYVVATPIGNLQDFSPRGQTILAEVACIAAEDTRHSRRLLTHFGISTQLVALHEHNEREASEQLLRRLRNGESIALISDAGTPVVSDPGFRFVQSVLAAGIAVSSIAGPSAVAAALSVAGLPGDKFVFEGFLAAKPGLRRQRLQVLAQETRTLVFYEAPHRIQACIEDCRAIFGAERRATLVKELTKQFETVLPGTLTDIAEWLAAEEVHCKGEFVIVVAGAQPTANAREADALQILEVLARDLPLKQAAKLTAEITGVAKNLLYKAGLEKV